MHMCAHFSYFRDGGLVATALFPSTWSTPGRVTSRQLEGHGVFGFQAPCRTPLALVVLGLDPCQLSEFQSATRRMLKGSNMGSAELKPDGASIRPSRHRLATALGRFGVHLGSI